ncbi:tyrosine--tRNA ligase [Candidatus Berkelbacteria bacterium]|nr:tyrosine--tRNA ligase [Candidatus Berkelbacteria bacterium]
MNTSQLLTRGVVDVIDRRHLEKRLKSGTSLRVKLGIDPTSPELHLGHTVVLRKLRQFQNAGHTAVLIIGDFTARIGDPSGRTSLRVPLTEAQIRANEARYLKQAYRVLDQSRIAIHHNSEWFGRMDLGMFIREVAFHVTKQQLQDRDDFVKRETEGLPITLAEMLYPMLQAYDSVQVKADVELGGTDQLFNLLQGRHLMKQGFGMTPQDIITTPLLIGPDGSKKMSKSVGNTINLDDAPANMYGKLMSIPDALIIDYFTLVTDLEDKALKTVTMEIKEGAARKAKAHLAYLIVEELYDSAGAEKAQAEFDRVFTHKREPNEMPFFHTEHGNMLLVDLLVDAKLAASKSEARRLIEQGGVQVGGKRVSDPTASIEINNTLIQVGKRRFIRVSTRKRG